MIEALLAGLGGYLLGSIPTGVLVGRAMRGQDVREIGSGHTGGLNVSRVAGPGGGALTLFIDVLLGMLAVAGTLWLTQSPWAAMVAGVMAVVGHNWSLFIRFGGGIGLSTLAGTLLYLDPLRALGALAAVALLWAALTKLRVHRARATILSMAMVGPLLWGLGFPDYAILLGALGGTAVIIKTIPDWNRKYERDA